MLAAMANRIYNEKMKITKQEGNDNERCFRFSHSYNDFHAPDVAEQYNASIK